MEQAREREHVLFCWIQDTFCVLGSHLSQHACMGRVWLETLELIDDEHLTGTVKSTYDETQQINGD